MKTILKLVAVLALLTGWAHAAPNTAVNTCTGVSTCAATFGSNTTAGSVFVVAGSASGFQGLSIADTVSNAFVLQPQGCGIDGGVRIFCIWLVYSSVGGADTITITDTGGGSNRMNLVAKEYTGMAVYPLDHTTPNVMSYSATSITTNSATSITSNDIAVAIGFSGNNSGSSSIYAASGYTSQASAISGDGRQSIALLDKTVSSPGSASATVTSNWLDGVGFVMLRAVLPTIGTVQTAFCTSTAASSLPCSFPQAATANDLLIAYTFANKADDVTDIALQQISGLCSVPWKTAPFGYFGTPPGGQVIFYCSQSSSTSTVTMSELGSYGNQQMDMALTEVRGIANATPILNLTYNVVEGITGNSNSITVSDPSSIYLYNAFGDDYSPNNYTNTGTSLVSQINLTGNYIKQINDTTTTSGTYTSTITGSHVQAYSTNVLIGFSTSNQTGVQVVQITNGGGNAGQSSTTKTFTVPTTASNTLLAIGMWQSPQTLSTTTDSLGNVWTSVCGGGSNAYGVWRTVTSGGADTVTMNPSSITTTMKLLEISGVVNFDTSSCSQLTGSSITPNQITTSYPTELLVSFAQDSGSCNPPVLTLANSGNWNSIGGSGSHCAQGLESILSVSSTGTYGNAASAASSTTLSAGILGFAGGSLPPSYVPTKIQGRVKLSGKIKIY